MQLYSYQPALDYKIDTLANHQLWFTRPLRLNDIFELKPPFHMTPGTTANDLTMAVSAAYECAKEKHVLTPDQTEIYLLKAIFKRLANESIQLDMRTLNNVYSQALERALSKVGVTCFSTNSINQLMWAYYAQSYSGFCVGYEIDSDQIKNSGLYLNPMNYSAHRPMIDLWQMLFTDFSKQVVFTKSMAWSHENEIRVAANENELKSHNLLIEANEQGFKIKVPNGVKMTEIILGVKTTIHHKITLSEIAKKISDVQGSEVVIKEIVPFDSQYSLTLQIPIQAN